MKRLVLLAIFLLGGINLFSQAPLGFNYQGVARDDAGTPLADHQLSVRISVLEGGPNGPQEYIETHSVATNSFGLVSLAVGQGDSPGQLTDVNWSTGAKWLQIEIDVEGGTNYQLVGSQQLLSVPFAMYASQAGPELSAGAGIEINENSIANTMPDREISLTGGGSTTVTGIYPDFTISSSDASDDADADPANELMISATLEAGGILRLTDAGGSIDVDLNSIITIDNDNQNLTNVLTEGTDANASNITNLADPVDAQDAATKNYVDNLNINDADADASNEIQDLSLVGNNLSITDNASATNIDLTPYVNSDNQTITDLSIDGSNILSITLAGGNTVTVDLNGLLNDADADAGNELQDLELVGNNLTLSSDVTPVDLTEYLDNTDNQDLTLTTNNLALSGDASTIDLSGYLDNTDAQNLGNTVAGTDRVLTISGGTGTTINVADNDDDPGNELITATSFVAGNTLRITEASVNHDVAVGTLNDNLNANSNKITNLTDPTLAQDAASKNYVDVADANLQGELNASQTGAGLNSDGTYTANAGANYITATTDLQSADNLLDAQVATNATDITANASSIASVATNLANNYAFSVDYSFVNGSGATFTNEPTTISTVNFDGFSQVSGNQVQIKEAGVYLFNVYGSSSGGGVVQVSLRQNGNNTLRHQVLKQDDRIDNTTFSNDIGQFLLNLSVGDYIEVIVESSSTLGDSVSGTCFGYKL